MQLKKINIIFKKGRMRFGLYIIRKTANGALHDIIHRFYQCIIYFQNVENV